MSTIKLSTNSILQVPIRNYEEDFTFLVNGEEFHTSKLVADLLSTKLSNEHFSDPTINHMIINTRTRGNFQTILDLINFNEERINDESLSFISEVFEQLEPSNIEIKSNNIELTIDNVISELKKHESLRSLYSTRFEEEVDFLSSHMYEISETRYEEIETLSSDTIESVINNSKLQLESEDQLLCLVNFLYSKSRENSNLYEFVDFVQVETVSMETFSCIIDKEDLTICTWRNLLSRMTHDIKKKENEKSTRININKNENDRNKNDKNDSKSVLFEIPFQDSPGLFNKIKETSNINEELKVTRSTEGYGSDVMTIFNSDNNHYGPCTGNIPNSWICIEVKNHRIIPTHYTVKTFGWGHNHWHPKSWVIEISDDNERWEIIDEEHDCSFLNGSFAYHTFPISTNKQHEFKFIRMRLTDKNLDSYYYLCTSTFEVFGALI